MIRYTPGKWGVCFAFSLKGSVFPMAFTWAFPCSALSVGLHTYFHDQPEFQNMGAGQVGASIMAGFTFVLGFLVVFRSQQAYSRWWEGGSLLQQLRGEWFNAYSNLLAFCNPAPEKQHEVLEFQHKLVRLVSLLYCAALQQVSTTEGINFELIEIKDFDHDSLEFLMGAHDRCEVVLQWIQRLIGEANEMQIIKVSPPILSRVYNQLGNGIVMLNNARKITHFLIPFPLAQMITFMLLVHWCITAFVCAASIPHTFWAGLISFIVVFSFWCINYIAVELEDPYGDDANDLPLDEMQRDLNISLSQLLHMQAQHCPSFSFKPEEHRQLRLSKSGIEEIMKEDELIRKNSLLGIGHVPPTSFREELDQRPPSLPPMLHVTSTWGSTVDLNNESAFNGMTHGSGSGKPGQQPIPPRLEGSSPPSQYAEHRDICAFNNDNCISNPGSCANKLPPSLSTARRPGCSPCMGKHANVGDSASNGSQIDASTASTCNQARFKL